MKKTKKEILFKINELNVGENKIDNLKTLVKKIKNYAIGESFAYTSEMDKKGISTTNPYLLKYREGDLYYDKEYYTTYGKIIVSSFIEIIKYLNNKYQKANNSKKKKIKNLVEEYTEELLFDNLDIIDPTRDSYIEIKNNNGNLTYEISKETIRDGLKNREIDKEIVDFINTKIKDLKKNLENNIENNRKSRNNENPKKVENNINNRNNVNNIEIRRRLEKFTNK